MAASLSRRFMSLTLQNSHKWRCRMKTQTTYKSTQAHTKKYETQGMEKTPELNLSESCIKYLHQIEENNNYLRVTVEGGGCSGFQYKFDIDTQIRKGDRVFEKDGAKVIIDEDSLEFVKGSTIDYHEELIRSSFRVIGNPMADQGCSCGASFSVKL